MATKKKPAARKAAHADLPKGFKPVSGFGESWPGQDPKKGATLQGTITGFDSYKAQPDKKGGKPRIVRIAKIETNDGKTFSVWESAGLRSLFEQETDTEVFIRFDGLGTAKRGQSAPKRYTVAAK